MTKTYADGNEKWFVTDGDLLPDGLICEIISQIIQTQIRTICASDSSNVRYYKSYLLHKKAAIQKETQNCLQILTCYDRYSDENQKETIYMAVGFPNLMLRLTGEVDLEYDMDFGIAVLTDIDPLLKEWEMEYDVEELYIEFWADQRLHSEELIAFAKAYEMI